MLKWRGHSWCVLTGDVDIAQGYPHFIVASKAFDPSSGLVYSGIEDARFAIQFVVQAQRTQDPVIQKFVKVFQGSDAVKAAIHKAFAQDKRLYTLVWLGARMGATALLHRRWFGQAPLAQPRAVRASAPSRPQADPHLSRSAPHRGATAIAIELRSRNPAHS